MLAAQKAGHGRSSEGGCSREGRTRHFRFVTQAIVYYFGFGVRACHDRYFRLINLALMSGGTGHKSTGELGFDPVMWSDDGACKVLLPKV